MGLAASRTVALITADATRGRRWPLAAGFSWRSRRNPPSLGRPSGMKAAVSTPPSPRRPRHPPHGMRPRAGLDACGTVPTAVHKEDGNSCQAAGHRQACPHSAMREAVRRPGMPTATGRGGAPGIRGDASRLAGGAAHHGRRPGARKTPADGILWGFRDASGPGPVHLMAIIHSRGCHHPVFACPQAAAFPPAASDSFHLPGGCLMPPPLRPPARMTRSRPAMMSSWRRGG